MWPLAWNLCSCASKEGKERRAWWLQGFCSTSLGTGGSRGLLSDTLGAGGGMTSTGKPHR